MGKKVNRQSKQLEFVSYLKGEIGLFGLIRGCGVKKGIKCFFDTGYAFSYEPLTNDEKELITDEDFVYMGVTEHSPRGSYAKFIKKRKERKEKNK